MELIPLRAFSILFCGQENNLIITRKWNHERIDSEVSACINLFENIHLKTLS